MKISYVIPNKNERAAALRTTTDKISRDVLSMLHGRGKSVIARMQRYPSLYAGSPPFEFATPKSRRYFFYALNAGIIKTPYQRSREYADAWSLDKIRDGYQINNPMPYAKYVGGDAYGRQQAGIHAGRWPLFRDTVHRAFSDVDPELREAVRISGRKYGFYR